MKKTLALIFFVTGLQTHEISDMAGPNHSREEKGIDLDDEDICITCKACHGHLYSYGCACTTDRKPKPGVSQQELDAMEKQGQEQHGLKFLDQYYENSLPVLCPHAIALLTVLRLKRDNPSVVEKEGEYTGQWRHTFVINGGRKSIPIEVAENTK